MSMSRVVLIGILALLSGCAGIFSGPSTEWQRLANQATTAFQASPVYVDDQPLLTSMYYCQPPRIVLGANRNDVRLSLAHELGHHIRRHCTARVDNEMEANALAVQVLEVWGDTRDNAVRAMVRKVYLARNLPSPTIHDGCGELLDLLRRYPAAVDPRQRGECGK